MASESTEERTVSVKLPAELDEWLGEQEATQGIDREALVAQLLAAYREIEEFDGDEGGIVAVDDDRIGDIVEKRLDDATGSLQTQVRSHIETLESEYQQQFDTLDEQVAQLTEQVDEKANDGHTHSDLVSQVETLTDEFETLREEYTDLVPEHDQQITTVEQRLDELEQRLETVAYLVNDLREAQESDETLDVVDRIKRIAAGADIEHANCGECGESVTLSLLVEPECPHCGTSVRDLDIAEGWFSSPELITGSGTPGSTASNTEDDAEDDTDAETESSEDA